jgi:ABC-type multidrug transport system fused ATPase/permease subunit
MWDPSVPEKQIHQAVRDACIYEDIASRPGGLDCEVEENGRNFSGGQRQRIEIARALVHNPSVIILDEATSALDAKTEHLIDMNLRRRGCTCLIIAHRLSTIRDCDEIIVMQKGEIVQRGTHTSLMMEKGLYLELIKE